MSTTARTSVVVGGICGLAWACAFRGWMAELARGDTYPEFTWTTLALVLAPGVVIGTLLGWSASVRSSGRRPPRWLVLSPALFATAAFDPDMHHDLVVDDTGAGALVVVATALSIGYVVTRGRWSAQRALCAVLGALGLGVVLTMGRIGAPIDTPRGVWICLDGVVLVLLLGLAAGLAHPPTRDAAPAAGWVLLGALIGLAWACALREFMAQVAGPATGVDPTLTFGYILLPGALIGACLGWAEVRRRRGGKPQWRLALSPFLFAAVLFSAPFDLGELFEDGIGGGTVGVPAIAILGGMAISGRGRPWGRAVAGLLFLAGFATWLLVATDVGGESFSLSTVHGIWVNSLYESLLVVFALGASVPQRRAMIDPPPDRATRRPADLQGVPT